jgi:hypothetical protein
MSKTNATANRPQVHLEGGPETCVEKERLLAAWRNSIGLHQDALAQLEQARETSPNSDYAVLCRVAEALLKRTLEALERLRGHLDSHGC